LFKGVEVKGPYEITINSICGWGKHWSQHAEDSSDQEPGGFVISWSAKGIGFGELTVGMDGQVITVDDECMSREFCDAVMAKLLDARKE
jgi:hypothetical protein